MDWLLFSHSNRQRFQSNPAELWANANRGLSHEITAVSEIPQNCQVNKGVQTKENVRTVRGARDWHFLGHWGSLGAFQTHNAAIICGSLVCLLLVYDWERRRKCWHFKLAHHQLNPVKFRLCLIHYLPVLGHRHNDNRRVWGRCPHHLHRKDIWHYRDVTRLLYFRLHHEQYRIHLRLNGLDSEGD